VVDAEVESERLGVRLCDGSKLRTRALVLTHGLSYEPPAAAGDRAAMGPVGIPLPVLRRMGGA
jgi:hypothetical protein